MPYQVWFTQRPGYLHAVVTGRNSARNVAAYLAQVHAECTARGCFRVLIEERLEGPRLGLGEILGIVGKARARTPGRFPTVAFVDTHARGALMPLAADVAWTHGLNVWVFASLSEAEQWLREVDDSADSRAP